MILCFLAVLMNTQAQGIKNVRINEVLVKNDSNCIDNYGIRSGWFEVFNTGYSTVNLGGCFVTNDINNPKKYRIAKGDASTILAPRSYAMFYAYQNSDRGIFHVNFSLDEKGFLALFDQSGKVLIDSVSYDIAAQIADISFGKMENIADKEAQWTTIENPTPGAVNYTKIEETRAEKFAKTDPHGFIITITCMGVVFLLLAFLGVTFTLIGRRFKRRTERLTAKMETDAPIAQEKSTQVQHNQENNDLIAIAMALHLYFNEQHEDEPTGFYLNRGLNFSNGWSAKYQMFKKSPNRNK
ncbi:MAG: OadG family protein [Bacteroidales bacterium]|nr:OadG family protein [Bacteroidales bacterium]